MAKYFVVFSNCAKYWVRGLQSCGIFKHCLVGGFKLKSLNFFPVEHCLFGGFNRLNFLGCWQFCGTFKNRNHWVASTTLAFPRGLQSCGILEHCHIFGVFNNSNVSSRLKILLYFQIWQNILLCFQIVQNIGSVACNLVVFSNIAVLVASN